MAARKFLFKQADVSRAVKGAMLGGMEVGRIEIDPDSGRITLIAGQAASEPENDFDKWIRENEGKA